MPQTTFYCTECGQEDRFSSAYCTACGRGRKLTPRARTAGVAFVLNEMQAPPMDWMLSGDVRAQLSAHYVGELRRLTGRTQRPGPEPAPVQARAPVPVAAAVPQPDVPAMPQRAAAPRIALKPREPRDWSWLAEQQANLFLFAGAFLTVVAALIYVAYSGQRVDGTLKMLLLVIYTLAFLAAGVVCLRYPRVRIAGQVFFGVGAILVPLNFVVARNILRDEDLSPQSLWLSGSIVTALFYTAVARSGLGRWYAFASGVSVASALAAVIGVGDVPVEWAPAMFIALAIAMSLPKMAGDEEWRERVGSAWALEADVLAVLAALAAMAIAPFAREAELNVATLWFLPVSFALFAVYALLQTTVRKREEAGAALIAGVAGVATGVVYALELPGEWHTVAFAALAPIFGVAMLWLDRDDRRGLAPSRFIDMLRLAAIGATCVATVVGLLYARTTLDVGGGVLGTRWFLLPAFDLMLVFYAIDGFVRREQGGLSGAALAVMGACASVVFALDVSREYYAFAFIGAGALMLLFVRIALPAIPARFLREDVTAHAAGYALAAVGMGAAIAIIAAFVSASAETTYEPQTLWFLFAAFGSAGATLCVYLTMRMPVLGEADRIATYGLAMAIAGAATGVVYATGWGAQYYAAAFVAAAALILVIEVGLLTVVGDEGWRREHALISAHMAAIAAAIVGISSALYEARFLGETSADPADHAAAMRWLLAALFGALAAFYVVAAHVKTRGWADASYVAAAGLVASMFGITTGVVYGLHAGAEYYAFAFIVPAVALALLTRASLPDQIRRLLPQRWIDGAFIAARAATLTGIAVALACVFAAARPDAAYHPDGHAFLSIAFAAASVFWVLDAMRAPRTETSAALVAAITGAVVSIAYAAQADAAWYGLSFVAAGLLLGFTGLVWTPGWIDARVRDAAAVLAVTIGWVAFEGAYVDNGLVGAVAHLAAAMFYAVAALVDRSELSLNAMLDLRTSTPVRVASGWLYAAGLTGTIGYLYALNAIPGPDDADAFAGLPIFALAAGCAVLAASSRYWRPEFRPHLYIISLALAIFSLLVPGTELLFAAMLTAYVALYALAAAWEGAPLLAVPAAGFGLIAVPAWRVQLDAPAWAIVASYTAIGSTIAVVAAALWPRKRRWGRAIGAASAVYAVVAPAAGFGMLAVLTHHARVDGIPFERTALYGWSTCALAVAGVLAVGGALIEERRWIIVPASLVLCVSLLLGIGHFHPGNAQAYTLVIGVYLIMFGLLALWKFQMVRGLSEMAPYIEALGAIIVMGPSFLQSFPSTWQYEMVVVIEAALFFAAGVILRRRGIVAAAILFLVAVATRSLFDAVNALPNWVVVMLAGMALLGVGMGILLGRDRWSAWQEHLLAWWDETASEPPASGHQVS